MKFVPIILGSLFIAASLSGCGAAGPENQAAHLLKQQMKDPSSFYSTDTKIMWQGKDKKNREAYVIKVDFKAQNSFGAVLPGCKMVAFAMEGESLSYNKPMAFDTCGTEGDPLFDPKQVAEVMSSQFKR